MGIDAVHVPHQARQVALSGVQQMVVIAHLAVGQHLRVEPIHRLGDATQLRQPVDVVWGKRQDLTPSPLLQHRQLQIAGHQVHPAIP